MSTTVLLVGDEPMKRAMEQVNRRFGNTKMESYEGTVITFEHCPGNGSRYFGVLAKVDDNKFLVTWLSNGDNGGTAFLFTVHSTITVGYLMEKMRLKHDGDAVALMVFLHQHTGVSVNVPHGFNDETGVWDGTSSGALLR